MSRPREVTWETVRVSALERPPWGSVRISGLGEMTMGDNQGSRKALAQDNWMPHPGGVGTKLKASNTETLPRSYRPTGFQTRFMSAELHPL